VTRHVLGKITASMDRPRGPDATLQLTVPAGWIVEGATIEIELPRNLACATCEGGGCDVCERSGAVSLRGRKEPPEIVEVTLPRGESAEARVIVRIPCRGGLPGEGTDLPRGNLLLSIEAGPEAPRGVIRLPGPSLPPPPPEAAPIVSVAPAGRAKHRPVALLAIAALILLVCILVTLLR